MLRQSEKKRLWVITVLKGWLTKRKMSLDLQPRGRQPESSATIFSYSTLEQLIIRAGLNQYLQAHETMKRFLSTKASTKELRLVKIHGVIRDGKKLGPLPQFPVQWPHVVCPG